MNRWDFHLTFLYDKNIMVIRRDAQWEKQEDRRLMSLKKKLSV